MRLNAIHVKRLQMAKLIRGGKRTRYWAVLRPTCTTCDICNIETEILFALEVTKEQNVESKRV